MSTRRFLAPELPCTGGRFVLPPEESRHAARVLRLAEGDSLLAVDGCGVEAEAVVDEPVDPRGRRPVCCRVLSRQELAPPLPRLRLYVALPRGGRSNRIVAQATELGFWRVTPILCRHSVAAPAERRVPDAWRREAVAAMKQSGNVFLPRFDPPTRFSEALDQADANGYFGAVPGPGAASPPSITGPGGEIGLWIGPEGGFTPEEIAALRGHGVRPVTVGNWTLRVETAVPALAGWVTAKVGHDNLQCERR